MDPRTRTISTHRGLGAEHAVSVFGEHDRMAVGEPMAGLRFRVGEVFS